MNIVSAAELMSATFPEPRWAVPGLIPEGVSVLAARPKIGKSWLMLGISIAVASGGRALGQIACQPGDVLYLALEDTPRRLQERLSILLDEGETVPERLYIATEWRRFDVGGLEDIDVWLTEHPGARMVVVDTLEKVRPGRKRDGSLYAEDYAALAGLKLLAEKHGIAAPVVHHLRKGKADDPFDTISGTLGLSAAADTNLVLERVRGAADAALHITGRDVEEAVYALRWEAAIAGWTILDIPVPDASTERLDIIRAVEALQPCGPSQVAERIGRPVGSVKQLMWKMAQDGHLAGGRSAYAIPIPGNLGNLEQDS